MNEPAPLQPLLFGRYQVVRQLGRGGMGVVLLAVDSELKVPVAIKVIPKEVAHDDGALLELRKEVLAGQSLTHPGIVRIHNLERSGSEAGIIMEFVEGPTLAQQKIKQTDECFNPDQILPWIEQICAALDYAHTSARIVHRDLKPQNLMLREASGEVKIADFGISATLSDTLVRSTGAELTSGTPPYMSPQQTCGERPSHLDDIYSLGATIYDLLTGRPPFFRGNIPLQVMEMAPPAMAERRAELDVLSKRGIPNHWETTVAACLDKDPKKRPASAGEVARLLKGTPVARTTRKIPIPASFATVETPTGVMPAPKTPPTAPGPVSSPAPTHPTIPSQTPTHSKPQTTPALLWIGLAVFLMVAMAAGGLVAFGLWKGNDIARQLAALSRKAGSAAPLPTAQPESEFDRATRALDDALASTLREVDEGTITADEGEKQLDRKQREYAERWGVDSTLSMEDRDRYTSSLAKVRNAPRDYADIFIFRRATDLFRDIKLQDERNQFSHPDDFLLALKKLQRLIETFRAIVDALKRDTSKASRLEKALSRIASLEQNFKNLSDIAVEKKNAAIAAREKRTEESRPVAVATPRPAPVNYPKGRKAMGSGVQCPYNCNPEYLHYEPAGPGDVVTCKTCGRKFRIP